MCLAEVISRISHLGKMCSEGRGFEGISGGACKDQTCGDDLFSRGAFKDESCGEDVFSVIRCF